jgi:hypothetical protein
VAERTHELTEKLAVLEEELRATKTPLGS